MQRLGVLLVVLLCACGDNTKLVTGDAGTDGSQFKCGNGMIDGAEQCDEGDANGGPNARCTTLCVWACLESPECSDNDPCNGEETCTDHRCTIGTELADGTTCGTDKLCRNAACTDSACGDGFITAPNEECDDGNSSNGDGCNNNCKYSCLSTDSSRNCTPADACAGQGTCNDTTHVCGAGTPLPNNSSCGTNKYCQSGTCTTAVCGNSIVEPNEACDHGIMNGTANDGCKADCQWVCVNAATDCATAAPACQINSCTQAHTCAAVADATKDNTSCGTNLVCKSGACVAPTAVCGNGTVETGEQCDFGTGNNGAGTGCETNCQFSCQTSPTDTCNDNNACNGTESCGAVTVNNRSGQKCSSTAALNDGATCATGKICVSQSCVTSTCGDLFTNTAAGEQCDPPNNTTCDANCKSITCGDGVRAGAEQCDDSNTTNLDGCDSSCKFEQCHRVNTLSMAFNTDTYCTANALGGSIVGGTAQDQITTALTNGVNDGSITIELKAMGLDDLTGISDPALTLGALTGSPVAGTGYNGASDVDWWYTTAATVVDALRNPTTTLPATIAAKILNAGPADITITVSLGGSPAKLDMLAAKLQASLGNATKPKTSTGSTPGHLAAEHLDAALTSFETAANGKLCGNVTAESLKNVPVPTALQGCGFLNCSRCYNASNSLLDVIVGGCSVLGITQIKPTQPDKARVAGDTYTFTTDATTKIVTGCKKNNVTTPVETCRNDAAYSSFLKFTTDRVIAK
jgi:cysteine-rich repeat protein